MSDIILPNEEPTPNEQENELKYQATEVDEENFFLMYHLNFQPSEVAALDPDYRKWIMARFIGQKKMEEEMMKQHQLMRQIGPSLRTH